MRHLGSVVIIAALVLVSVLVVVLRDSPPENGIPSSISLREETDNIEAPLLSTTAEEGLDSLDTPISEARTPGYLGLACVIRDPQGTPISGATLSWSSVPDAGSIQLGVFERDWDLHLESSAWAESDDSGAASFPSVPAFIHTDRSVLWVSCPGFHASFTGFDKTEAETLETLLVTLAPAPRSWVDVADEENDVVADAYVIQVGLTSSEVRSFGQSWPTELPSGIGPLEAREALTAFFRRYVTDAVGAVELAPLSTPSALRATRDGECSGPALSDPEGGRERLVLRTSLVARGRVNSAAGGPVPDGAFVEYSWRSGSASVELGRARVGDDEKWGPVTLPDREEGEFAFRLAGGNVIPQTATRSAPAESPSLQVDFVAEFGVRQEIVVRDKDEVPLPDARVQIIWQDGDGWPRSVAWTDSEGVAVVEGCRETTTWVRASKSGYLEQTIPSVVLPRPGEFVVELPRAGRLRGVVVHDGNPVEDFEVLFWWGSPNNKSSHVFSGCKDGRFELDTVPLGRITFMASSGEYPESEVVTVEVTSTRTEEIQLELGDGVVGFGSVADAISGEPIPTATIQLHNHFVDHLMTPRGPQVAVAPDGSFELSGLSPRGAGIKVGAPGYVLASGLGAPDGEGRIDFGTITLAGRQTLRVRLGGEAPFDTSALWFLGRGDHSIPYHTLSSEGVLEIPDVAPGAYGMMLVFEDASTIMQNVRLEPGEEWEVIFPYSKGAALEVRVIPGASGKTHSGLSTQTGLSLQADTRNTDGIKTMRVVGIPEDGVARLDYLQGDLATLVVFEEGSYVTLASVTVELDGSGTQVVELSLENRSLRVLLTDAEGDPLSEGRVLLRAPDDPDLHEYWVPIDGDGSFTFEGLGEDRYVVIGENAEFGLTAPLEVDLRPRGLTECTLELEGGSPLDLEIIDTDGAVSGAEIVLVPPGYSGCSLRSKTDSTGRFQRPGVAHGDYTIDLERSGYWPTTHLIHFTGQPSIPLPIRRRGKLEAIITTPSDTPIPGAQLTLYSVEFDTTVATWLAEGKLESSAAALQSDTKGRVFAHGIPHGVYGWTVTGPSGAVASGQITIPPGETLETSFQIGD
jgi:hypothetical protein